MEDNTDVVLSSNEQIVVDYLRPLMEANAGMIGKHLSQRLEIETAEAIGCGISVCSQLRKKGLISRLPDLNAWRLTQAGREIPKTS